MTLQPILIDFMYVSGPINSRSKSRNDPRLNEKQQVSPWCDIIESLEKPFGEQFQSNYPFRAT